MKRKNIFSFARPMRLALFLLCVFCAVALGAEAEKAEESAKSAALSKTIVYIAEMDGVIGVPLEEHVEVVFDKVRREENVLLIFKMNTPGGLVDSMSAIITRIAEADYPVVVWVAPSGARAASAGAFIVQAAHVAAMAPGTNIGAAHPVTGSGKDIDGEEMGRKVTNDLIAKIRSFAQERGRNVEVAEKMVSDSISLTAREALEQNVIDFIASGEDELFSQLDGREILIKGRSADISLENREVRRIDMTMRLRMLELFSRPDIAYLALLAGIFLIILEVKSPGGFVLGVSGAILLLVAAYGLRVLPVNMAGVALLVGGIVIIIADLVIGSMGVLAVAGIGAMLFGGLILYRAPGGELLRLSAGFIVGVTLVVGAFFLFILRLIYKALKQLPSSGVNALIGRRVTLMEESGRYMMTFVHGEYWRVILDESVEPKQVLKVGDEVEIARVESLVLYVTPVEKIVDKVDKGGDTHE